MTVLVLAGRLDPAARAVFREQIQALLGRGGAQVVVDVGGLDAIDIAGMAALLRADLLLAGVHSTMTVRGASPVFLDLMRAACLDGRLHLEPVRPLPDGERHPPSV